LNRYRQQLEVERTWTLEKIKAESKTGSQDPVNILLEATGAEDRLTETEKELAVARSQLDGLTAQLSTQTKEILVS